jgi:hypothetical protein
MSPYRDISLVLDDWLAEGAAHAPDRVIDRVMTDVGATPQRRAWPLIGGQSVHRFAGLSAAAVLVLAVTGAIVVMLARPVGPLPGGSPSPAVSPTPSVLEPGDAMQSGVVYSVPAFKPGITLHDLAGWRLASPLTVTTTPGSVGEIVLEAPSGTRVTVMQPSQAVEPEGGPIISAPAFIDSWLWSRGDLAFLRKSELIRVPPSIVVDGWHGRDLEGSVATVAVANPNGQIVLLCAPEYACTSDSEDQLAVRPGDDFRIVVLNVNGTAVVLEAATEPAAWANAGSDLTNLLNGIHFESF